jgi:predicted nucleic acid-binding protein
VIVVDTNLLVYLYVRGQGSAAADKVYRRDQEWAAPALWRSEFRNVLAFLVRRRELPLDDAVRFAHEAERHMSGQEYSIVSHRVLQLAAESGCSAYDCEFVALARDLEVPLVTADRQLLAAFPSTAVSPEAFVG